MIFLKKSILALVGLLLVGCSALPFKPIEPGLSQATTVAAPTHVLSTPQKVPQALTPTTIPTPAGPPRLRVWVPPQFDPSADTPASKLLRQRLDEFSQRRPDVLIEVRVKGLDGPGGLYESLVTSTAAAQLVMPDLVLLPHPIIQTAAVKGLLRPMNGLTNALDDTDWYDYARPLASLQNSIFGLPFAGDALTQVYRTGENVQANTTWQSVLEAENPFAFPAADPLALFTLAMYQAAGGKISDDQGKPMLEVDPLVKILDFYKSGEEATVMPSWLTQIQNDDQAWQALRDNRAGALATWLSRFYQEGLGNSAVSEIPTPDGKPFTLSTGWAWTLTSPDSQRRQLAVQLAEFLTESNFMGLWSEAAGTLPARPSAFEAWQSAGEVAKLNAIAASSHLYPPAEILGILGPALEEAVVAVLKGQQGSLEAAQTAVKQVGSPK